MKLFNNCIEKKCKMINNVSMKYYLLFFLGLFIALPASAYSEYNNYSVIDTNGNTQSYIYKSNAGNYYDSSGYTYQQNNNTIYTNSGTSYQRYGNMIQSSGGKQYIQTGNLIEEY